MAALPLGEYRWAFDKACKAVGIEGLVPHGLRHTTASLAISAGANVKVAQRLLGHATAAMTLDRYGHLLTTWPMWRRYWLGTSKQLRYYCGIQRRQKRSRQAKTALYLPSPHSPIGRGSGLENR